MNENRRKLAASALAMVLCAAAAGCGDPTGVGQGTVSATMYDGSSAGQQASMQPSVQPASSSRSSSSYQGQASGSAQVYIYSEAEGWVSLGFPANVNVTLQSDDETAVHAAATVPAETYTQVRLVLDGFQANVDAGAVLGGVTFSAAVSVRMGGSDGYVEIEKSVTPFTVTANGGASLRFDLNTEVWMDEETAPPSCCPGSRVTLVT